MRLCSWLVVLRSEFDGVVQTFDSNMTGCTEYWSKTEEDLINIYIVVR